MAIITRTFYMRLPCHRHAPGVQKVALVVSLVEEKANREKTWQVVEKCWWARQDSNLQPDRYERSALPESSFKTCVTRCRTCTFVPVCSRGFCGVPEGQDLIRGALLKQK